VNWKESRCLLSSCRSEFTYTFYVFEYLIANLGIDVRDVTSRRQLWSALMAGLLDWTLTISRDPVQ
jgi:hypothetical protein